MERYEVRKVIVCANRANVELGIPWLDVGQRGLSRLGKGRRGRGCLLDERRDDGNGISNKYDRTFPKNLLNIDIRFRSQASILRRLQLFGNRPFYFLTSTPLPRLLEY